MAATPISQADIDGLALALDRLAVPAAQKALLSAIVSAASHAIAAGAAPAAPMQTVSSIRAQFASAFTPGKADDLVSRFSHIGR
jgi:hypothetical protein